MTKRTQPKKAKVITPPNAVLIKAGRGGLPDHLITKAEDLIKNTSYDIKPSARDDFKSIETLISPHFKAGTTPDQTTRDELESLAMTIRANAGMFHYALIYEAADSLVYVLGYIENYNDDAVKLLQLLLRVLQKVIDNSSAHALLKHEAQLIQEVDKAILRYCKRYPKATASKD